MDKYTYDICSLIAQYAGAIGTISATVVALYFARRDRSIQMDIICEIATIFYPPSNQNIEIISIRISNIGYREFIIDNLYWKLPFKKIIYSQLYDPIIQGTLTVPTKLTEGCIAEYQIRLSDFEEYAKIFIDSIKYIPSFFSRYIRFGVYTTKKKKYETIIGNYLREWIVSTK